MIFIELTDNLTKDERQGIKEILVLYGLIEIDDCWMIDDQQYKLAINQILKEFVDIDVSKRTKRDIRIIDMKNDLQPPKWFTEFVEKRFDPLAKDVASLKTDVADIKVRVSNLEVRVTKLETKLDTVIKLNNLKTE